MCGGKKMKRFWTDLRSKLPGSLLTYALFCVFGIGSWIAINGIWAEISILVLTLPECYTLPAILVITIQCANLGPLTYTVIKYLFSRCRLSSKEYYLEVGAVFTLVTVGTVACVLLVFFWDSTAHLFGSNHSIALIVLTFFLALVDCTSSVVFLPFMRHFPAEYISALYVGEGSSGVLASVVALSQGFVNNNITSCMYNYTGINILGIHFSPNVYFIFLAAMMILCGLAFLGINVLPNVRKQMIPLTQAYSQIDSSISSYTTTTENNTRTESPDSEEDIFDSDSEGDDMFKDSIHNASESEELTPHTDSPEMIIPRDRRQGQLQKKTLSPIETKTKDSSPTKQRRFHIKDNKKEKVVTRTASGPLLQPLPVKKPSHYTIFVRILWSNFTIYFCLGLVNFLTNGALPAISPYVFINYGNEVYHIAVNLALFVNPIVCVFYLLVSHKSTVVTVMLTAITQLLAIYLLVVAIMSPDPWLKTQLFGKILIVSSF